MERSPHRSRFSCKTCDPMEDPHWCSLFLKDSTLWRGPILVLFLHQHLGEGSAHMDLEVGFHCLNIGIFSLEMADII